MWSTSSYKINSGPSKPDVCAPGTYIYYANGANSTDFIGGNGTSFSAPYVTGMIAQMLQIYPNWTNTTAIKAYVLLGANPNKTTARTPLFGAFNEKSGAGFIDAVKSVDLISKISLGSNCYPAYYYSNASTNIWDNAGNTINLKQNQKIRVIMNWENLSIVGTPGSSLSDFNIRLTNVAGAQLVASVSSNNNVEILEYTASSAITVQIQSILVSNNIPANSSQYTWICWYIE